MDLYTYRTKIEIKVHPHQPKVLNVKYVEIKTQHYLTRNHHDQKVKTGLTYLYYVNTEFQSYWQVSFRDFRLETRNY